MRKARIALLLVSVPFLLFAQQQNDGDSPSGKIHFVVRGDDSEKQIYLSEPGANSQEVALCETPGWGNLVIHFSPDDYWLVVQDGGPSLGISLRLFRRDKGVKFIEQKNANIDGKAERRALGQNGFPSQEILDHRYVKVLAWSRDSKRILISLGGHGGTPEQAVSIENWIGIYDFAHGEIGFDLGSMNRGALEKEAKTK
jgi:hypothetical protein